MKTISVNGKTIGPGRPCYIVAEMSANHGGSFERAMAIVKAAADAGADAVKLQTYTPKTMTLDCDNEYFRVPKGSLWAGRRLYELYAEAMTPWEWHAPLQKEAARLGLDFFSTPFDETAVDFLEQLAVPVYKVASFELTDDPLLSRIARTGKPVIMSTGLASREEIARALSVLAEGGSGPVALLKCTSAYPADYASMNLRAMPELARVFNVPAGLSDHSPGSAVPVAAVALGAVIIEKHLHMDDGTATADSAFSLSPAQFALLVTDVRRAQSALGTTAIGRTAAEEGNARFRRSVFVAKNVAAGEILTTENIKVVRPGFGLAPAAFSRVLGKAAAGPLKEGAPLTIRDVAGVPGQSVLRLRAAGDEDARFVFELRNLPDVRQQSTQSGPIAWDTHAAWFAGKLRNPACRLMIAVDEAGKAKGQVRFDLEAESAQVSIALEPDARGGGAGASLLSAACARLFGECPALRRVYARIKVRNSVSAAAFFRAGFRMQETRVEEGEDHFYVCLTREAQ